MSSLNYNPIIIYKQQGLEQPEDMNNVSDDDFLLGIQTEFQKDNHAEGFWIIDYMH